MPDWKQVVRERMGQTHLPADTQEDVIAELALHLEEVSESARASGLTASAATALALQEVQNWRALSAQISRARSEEKTMNHRTKSLWIPALASTLGASLTQATMQWMGVRPHLVWTGPVAMSFYWPWLATLPVFGALGAYLSRRAGGPVRSRLLACLAPVLWLFVLTLLTEPIELASRGFSHLPYYCYGMTNWVVIPGMLLLLGALPFLRESLQQHETAK